MKKKAFTLIELLIIVTIIGVLTAIAIPVYSGYQTKAKSSELQVPMEAISGYLDSLVAEGITITTSTVVPPRIITPFTQSGTKFTNNDKEIKLTIPSGGGYNLKGTIDGYTGSNLELKVDNDGKVTKEQAGKLTWSSK